MKNKFLKTFIFFSLLSAGVSAQPGHKLLPAEQEIPLNYGADRPCDNLAVKDVSYS